MGRPMKAISVSLKDRNANISAETSKFILDSTIKISRKIASNWTRYADLKQLTQDITTETLVAILTSPNFDPNKSHAQLYNYIRRTAETRSISLVRSLKKKVDRLADFSSIHI